EAVTRPAPAPMSKKPRVALIALPRTWPMPLLIAAMPIAVIITIRKAGTARISLTKNCAMARTTSIVVSFYLLSKIVCRSKLQPAWGLHRVEFAQSGINFAQRREVFNHPHGHPDIAYGCGDFS